MASKAASLDSPSGRTRRLTGFWRGGFLVALAMCLLAFLWNAIFSEIRSDNAWGLAYGIAAAVLLAATALYGLRRRAMRAASRFRLGRARAWLDFHVYGGLVFLVLLLMHSGFKLPNGALTWSLWGLSLWTVASGLLGLLLQRWIPRVLASGLSIEVNYERIPELVAEIRRKAETLAKTSPAALKELYRKKMEPALLRPERRAMFFIDITGGIKTRLRDFDYLRGFLAGEEKEHLEELARLYRSKLEIDAHYTLQQALRLWLWLHLPAAMLLVALVALHILTVIYW